MQLSRTQGTSQLFFLRNWRDPKVPILLTNPSAEEMVKVRDRVRVSGKVKRDEEKKGWPTLKVSDEVRGQHPKTNVWDMAGEVADIVHGGRAVFVKFYGGGSRLFKRPDVKKDTAVEYKVEEEEELEKVWKGFNLEVRKDEELEETHKSPRKASDALENYSKLQQHLSLSE